MLDPNPASNLSTTDLSQNTFLQDLQYKFDFHTWSDLFDIAVKARSQADNLDELLKFFACRGHQLNERLLSTEQSPASRQVKLHFMGQVKSVVEKVNASMAVLEEVKARTRDQERKICDEAMPALRPVEVEAESFFSPGKKLVFLDDAREYDRGLRRYLASLVAHGNYIGLH
ncbi:MAG: hypothetical protein Q9208_006309 [Pyrenodesmia sp. 3 TL-2023]